MSIQLTRKELYDMVWERPVIKVAAEFDVSDVAIHKICRKHNVPVPPRGYWAKLAAGKTVHRTPLPKEVKERLDHIEIVGSPAKQLPQAVLDAQTQGFALEAAAGNPSQDPNTIPEILTLRKTLDRAKPKKDGFVRIASKRQFSICVTPATRKRAQLALERIVGAALARGYKLISSDAGLALKIDGEQISIAVEETTKRVPHVPTAAETSKMERWDRKYQEKIRRHEWVSTWDKPEIPEFDEVPSGQLLVEIDRAHCWDGLRRRFRDGKRQRVENLAEKIVSAAAACAAAAIERKEEAERRQQEREEHEKHRQEQERLRTLEEKRWEFLESKREWLEKAKHLERFVADYNDSFEQEEIPEACQKFLEWASKHARLIRAKISPNNLASILEKHDLMNDQANISSWARVDR